MSDVAARSFRRLAREAIWHGHHMVIAAVVSGLAWLLFQEFGRDPDLIEAGWLFFCVMGILFHRENLSETYRDREAVRIHPASNDADLRNLGNNIRGEWLQIAVMSLFMCSGFVSLYFMPRVSEKLEAIRSISVICLMAGVALMDIRAIFEKLGRRELVRIVIDEINARPLGLSEGDRLERAIVAARDMFHDDLGEWAVVVGALEVIRVKGQIPDDLDIGELLDGIDRHLSDLREIHALIRSYDPEAGGPPRATRRTEG